jgi:hypothetical protein
MCTHLAASDLLPTVLVRVLAGRLEVRERVLEIAQPQLPRLPRGCGRAGAGGRRPDPVSDGVALVVVRVEVGPRLTTRLRTA